MFVAATNALVRVFLSPLCASCSALLELPLLSPVCPACWRAVPKLLPPRCVRCGDALPSWRVAGPLCVRCRRHDRPFDIARSVGLYDGSLRAILHAFKYERRRALAGPLGQLMRDAGPDVLTGADAVVPVPLHPLRSFQRGFNQADDLARELGLPVWRVLRRRRHGPPQARLPASRRHANVREAFALRHPLTCPWPPRSMLRNATVVLIDDVMTTGATMEACGRVLLSAGVRSVRALTVARTAAARPARPPPRLPLETVRRR